MQKGEWRLLLQVHVPWDVAGAPCPSVWSTFPKILWVEVVWTVVSPHVSTCREQVPRKSWRRKVSWVIKCLFI